MMHVFGPEPLPHELPGFIKAPVRSRANWERYSTDRPLYEAMVAAAEAALPRRSIRERLGALAIQLRGNPAKPTGAEWLLDRLAANMHRYDSSNQEIGAAHRAAMRVVDREGADFMSGRYEAFQAHNALRRVRDAISADPANETPVHEQLSISESVAAGAMELLIAEKLLLADQAAKQQ